MARVPPLNLTRDQLATFLKDHEQIKQFERLFATVEQIAPDVVNEVSTAAANAQASAAQVAGKLAVIAQELAINAATAQAKAQQALDTLAAMQQQLDALTVAPQALDTISSLQQQVDLLSTAPPQREFKRSRYGSFYDTTTQTATTINTATEVTFNTTDLSSGVYLGGTPQSRIYVDTDGIYNFQLSVQLDKTSGGTAEFYLWFRLNGSDVTDSASQIRIQGNNSEIFTALNYFFSLKAGDYVEVMYSVSDISVQLLAVPAATPHPGIPSIILTVSNNIQGFQ